MTTVVNIVFSILYFHEKNQYRAGNTFSVLPPISSNNDRSRSPRTSTKGRGDKIQGSSVIAKQTIAKRVPSHHPDFHAEERHARNCQKVQLWEALSEMYGEKQSEQKGSFLERGR